MVVGVVLAVTAGLVAGWYVYDRTGPRDAAAAGERLRADTQTLASELGLRDVTPDMVDDLGAAGEKCGVWQGNERLTEGAHRQHRIAFTALPPRGRAATGLRGDAEAILRRLGYRIITDEVDFSAEGPASVSWNQAPRSFDQAPPEGIVIATWGWSGTLEITLWPDPESDTVGIIGSASCLPAG